MIKLFFLSTHSNSDITYPAQRSVSRRPTSQRDNINITVYSQAEDKPWFDDNLKLLM